MEFILVALIVAFAIYVVFFYKPPPLPAGHPAADKWLPTEVGNFNGVKFLVDRDNKKIGFSGFGIFYVDAIENIVEVEVVVDKNSIAKTSKSSMATRALVGGVLLGGVGAVIGGVSAKKHPRRKLIK